MENNLLLDLLGSGVAGAALVSLVIVVKSFLHFMGNHLGHTDEVLDRLASTIDKLSGKIDGMK